jgi:hypothetical protein
MYYYSLQIKMGFKTKKKTLITVPLLLRLCATTETRSTSRCFATDVCRISLMWEVRTVVSTVGLREPRIIVLTKASRSLAVSQSVAAETCLLKVICHDSIVLDFIPLATVRSKHFSLISIYLRDMHQHVCLSVICYDFWPKLGSMTEV